MLYNLKRLTGYALGFIVFYAPVAALPVLFALRQLAAAEYSRPLLSYTDRAYFRRNNLAADIHQHA